MSSEREREREREFVSNVKTEKFELTKLRMGRSFAETQGSKSSNITFQTL